MSQQIYAQHDDDGSTGLSYNTNTSQDKKSNSYGSATSNCCFMIFCLALGIFEIVLYAEYKNGKPTDKCKISTFSNLLLVAGILNLINAGVQLFSLLTCICAVAIKEAARGFDICGCCTLILKTVLSLTYFGILIAITVNFAPCSGVTVSTDGLIYIVLAWLFMSGQIIAISCALCFMCCALCCAGALAAVGLGAIAANGGFSVANTGKDETDIYQS